MPIPVSSDRAIPIPQTSLLSFARFMMSSLHLRCGLRNTVTSLRRILPRKDARPVSSSAIFHKSLFLLSAAAGSSTRSSDPIDGQDSV